MRLITRNIIATVIIILISLNAHAVIAAEHHSEKEQKRESRKEAGESYKSRDMHKGDEERNVKTEKIHEYVKREKKEKRADEAAEKKVVIYDADEPIIERKKDFNITIGIKGVESDAAGIPRLSNNHEIRVRREPAVDPDEKYTVVHYLDNRALEVFSDVRLPFRFKRTFRGTTNGIHTIGIQVVDKDGKVGIDTYRVEVRH